MDPNATEEGRTAPEGNTPEANAPACSVKSAPTSTLSKGLAGLLALVMLGSIFKLGRELWTEYQGLRIDLERARLSQPVGFINITPNPTFARPPRPWFREEGDSLLLWAGWRTDGGGHTWFRVGRDQLDPGRIHVPFGRDVVRAIDRPLVEVGAGRHWTAMQPDFHVIGHRVGGAETAYPLLLLERVEVVNDIVGGQPLLVVFTPFVGLNEAVDLYEPILAGEHLTFGLSGIMIGPERRPLLYDRQTESLWMVREHRLECQAGTHRGESIPLLNRGVPVEWGTWSATNGGGRLIIGAERDRPERLADRPLTGN